MSKPLLRIRNLSLSFSSNLYRSTSWRDAFVGMFRKRDPQARSERVVICDGLNLDVFAGDRVALVGRNGAGKTSLCRCIAGFYLPDGGSIGLNGKIRALFEPSTVVQAELTGRENAWLLAQLMYPGENISELVEEALDFSELGNFLDTPMRTYSKGMLARLGLSLSAMRGSDILILDEVFDGADSFFREKISRKMAGIINTSGAVIFVSHSADQIRHLCNRLVILENGKIRFDGKVEEGLYDFESIPARFPTVTQ